MNEVKYVQGDLFSLLPYTLPTTKIIAHVCNDVGAWGSGFVVPLGKKFPEAERAYREWAINGQHHLARPNSQFELGNYQLVKVNGDIPQADGTSSGPVYVANIIGQHSTITRSPSGTKPIRYSALATAMAHIGENWDAEIHCPKFGSGLAGGNWELIEELIKELWVAKGLLVTVYEYVPPTHPL
jgi:O-acetyl-ADP-ribose deacetylase (regulator of RNase III)